MMNDVIKDHINAGIILELFRHINRPVELRIKPVSNMWHVGSIITDSSKSHCTQSFDLFDSLISALKYELKNNE